MTQRLHKAVFPKENGLQIYPQSRCKNCGCEARHHAILAKSCTSVQCPNRMTSKACKGFVLEMNDSRTQNAERKAKLKRLVKQNALTNFEANSLSNEEIDAIKE